MKFREVRKILEDAGFTLEHQNKHYTFKRENVRLTVAGNHTNKEIANHIVSKIFKKAGVKA